jgi:phosphoglycolate phosphatase
MATKAIIWDLDGTLIHFKIDFVRARKEAIKILQKHGIPRGKVSIKNSIMITVKRATETFSEMGYPAEKIQDIMDNVNKIIIEIEREAALTAIMVEGIDQVLEYVKNKELKQAIYTFNTNENAKISLETVGLLKYFNCIAGRDNVTNPKPHPDHLHYICGKIGVKLSDIIVIGDNHRDIEGALNVGARSIAVFTKISRLSSTEMMKKADRMIKEEEPAMNIIQAIKELS